MNFIKSLLMSIIQYFLKKRKYYVVSEKKLNQYKSLNNTKHKFYLSFDEIYKKNFNNNKIIIFDVGANRGQSIIRFKELFPKSVIHSFEPIDSCIKEIKNLNFTDVILNNYALGEKFYKKKFYKYKNDEISSFYNISDKKNFPKHINTEVENKFESQINTLDRYLEEKDIIKIDILKIDTQGYEEKVIDGSNTSLKKGIIKFIELEVIITNNYEFDYFNKFSIFNKLNNLNYKLVGIDSISYNKNNYISQFNALFKFN